MKHLQPNNGNVSTMWDPRSTPAWLDLDFGKAITVEAVGVTSGGDITHDIKAFTLETSSSPAPSPSGTPWQQLPHPSNVHIESRDQFHNIVPMGLPANASEVAELAAAHPSARPCGFVLGGAQRPSAELKTLQHHINLKR